MADLARLSLNSATVKNMALQDIIPLCASHGVTAIGPWRDKVQALGVENAASMIADHGLSVSSLCRGGMFTASDDEGRKQALVENRRAVDEAVAIGAQCLVLVVGGLPGNSKDITDARQQVRDGLGALLDHARACHMPLAIEPLHPMYAAERACVNTLAHANDLCDELGEGVGIAVDAYHVWWDPDLATQIARASGRILGFHVCDWLNPTTDMLLDRGMMGDGVIDLATMRQMVEAAGYHGLMEVEIFSAENWWKKPGEEVVKTVIDRFDACV